MTDDKKNLFVSTIIEENLWNRAKWYACVWGSSEDTNAPPILGLLFGNDSVGKDIFGEWKANRFGPVDIFDEMRIAIIKGNDEKNGNFYFLHIGLYVAAVDKRAKSIGLTIDHNLLLVSISRVHKFPTSDNYYMMNKFIASYDRHHRYSIVPCGATNRMPILYEELGIVKTRLEVRNISDIGDKSDPDHVLLSHKD